MTPIAYIIDKSMLTIALSMYYSITSSKIENWTPKIRNCYYQHEKVLKFFKLYTYQNCKLECVANNTLRTCGCNAFYQPSKNYNNLLVDYLYRREDMTNAMAFVLFIIYYYFFSY